MGNPLDPARPKLVVVESPYATSEQHSLEEHLDYARRAMRHAMDQFEVPFASHLMYAATGVLDDASHAQRQLGINCGYAWAMKADLVAFYTDLGWSRGMRLAFDYYSAQGLEIVRRQINN